MQSPAACAGGLRDLLFGVAYTFPTFKFQSCCESIDWRHINALNLYYVAPEVDVAALQENITGVTFCNMEQEACSCCRQPVDLVLLKVLRLAQLSIKYLLHCQEGLSAGIAQLEAWLQASLHQQQQSQVELGCQADELKVRWEESHWHRKMISTIEKITSDSPPSFGSCPDELTRIQTLALRKVEGIHEAPKAADTEEDSPEEELEDSRDELWEVLATLRRNPALLKQFRPVLEDTLEEKLESMGIKKDAKGISIQTCRHLKSLLRIQREQKARRFSQFLSLREKLIEEATKRVKERQENGAVVSQPASQPPGGKYVEGIVLHLYGLLCFCFHSSCCYRSYKPVFLLEVKVQAQHLA
ncbi:PREDICTED: LOW QUALITY PROTEIN: zinc finger protein DZIP1L-like [Galeopterus variegatus]|uniref:LOW QUALITY PROTEIN: zinc finger protein DZIP1L-like n=1 Tax=Galeopterus variegatus TaxID=482537 RepID=A0ABM0S7X0_GALVR|nr:PREDICTED: LOW QUALITY PROTEIN: zinc finger protein DZIP1L-like [Galeopterus variegatus]